MGRYDELYKVKGMTPPPATPVTYPPQPPVNVLAGGPPTEEEIQAIIAEAAKAGNVLSWDEAYVMAEGKKNPVSGSTYGQTWREKAVEVRFETDAQGATWKVYYDAQGTRVYREQQEPGKTVAPKRGYSADYAQLVADDYNKSQDTYVYKTEFHPDYEEGYQYTWEPTGSPLDKEPAAERKTPLSPGRPLYITNQDTGELMIYDEYAKNGRGAYVGTGDTGTARYKELSGPPGGIGIRTSPDFFIEKWDTNTRSWFNTGEKDTKAETDDFNRRVAYYNATTGKPQGDTGNIFAQIAAAEAARAKAGEHPSSWLQAGNQVVQPWMMGLLPQDSGLKVGDPIPGITGGNYSTANATPKTWNESTKQWEEGPTTAYATYNPYDFSKMPVLTRPSAQYFARMPYEGQQGYYGYQQAKTGQTAEGVAKSMWQTAPPSGKNKPLKWLR